MQKYVSCKYHSQFVFAVSPKCVIIIITKCIKSGPHGILFALADLQFGEHTHAQINIVATHCCSKYTNCLMF